MENADVYGTNGEADGANTDDASLQPLMPCLDNDGLAVGAFQSSSTPPGIPEVGPFTASSMDWPDMVSTSSENNNEGLMTPDEVYFEYSRFCDGTSTESSETEASETATSETAPLETAPSETAALETIFGSTTSWSEKEASTRVDSEGDSRSDSGVSAKKG